MERETEKQFIQQDEVTKEAIRKWDEFVTPIREFYGVPRYVRKPKKDGDKR
jgi:hypothetical protein